MLIIPDLTPTWVSPALHNGITLPIFMLSGNTPCVNDLLQISDKGLAIYDTTFFLLLSYQYRHRGGAVAQR